MLMGASVDTGILVKVDNGAQLTLNETNGELGFLGSCFLKDGIWRRGSALIGD